MKELRIAIIGVGSMGKKYATMIHRGNINGLILTAVCCRSEANKQWVRDNLSNSIQIFSSADLLFEHRELFDSVLIVTPHKEHPELVKKAFALFLHVFCDKPAGITSKDARQMNDLAKQSGMAYSMMFHKRTMPIYQAIKHILDKKELGTLLRATFINTESLRTRDYHLSSSWRSSWEQEGGGLLINQAQHPLDLWYWWFGSPTSIISDIPFGKINSFLVDDESTLLMKYSSGMSGCFIVSTIEGGGAERIEISGSKGKLILEHNTLTQYIYDEPSDEFILSKPHGTSLTYSITKTTYQENPSPYETMLINFTDHILHGVPLLAPGEDGLYALELANAAYLSAWKDKKIFLPLADEEYISALTEAIKIEKERTVFPRN